MTTTLSAELLSWLATYSLHSTVLLGLAWLITRWRRITPGGAEIIWKSALLGGLLTASVQLWLDLRPAGSLALGNAVQQESAPPAQALRPAVSAGVPRDVAPAVADPGAVTAASPQSPAFTKTSMMSAAVVLWGVIALALAAAYAARRLILIGRLGDRETLTEGSLISMLESLASQAGVRTPRLTITTRISSPVALGTREICLPHSAVTELDAEQQRSMLAHELAHLARRDPVWLVIASTIERVMWFQPLNRIARREITTAAEYLSDDWAVRRTGSGVALARCLAQVAEWIQASPLGVPVAGMAEERSLLVTRVARLLENNMTTMTPRRLFALGALAALLATVFVVPTVAGRPLPQAAAARPDSSGSADGPVLQVDSDAPTTARERLRAQLCPSPLNACPIEEIQRKLEVLSGDSTIVLALIARLKDEDAEVRQAAAQALGQREDPRAVPGLVDALKDSDASVRAAAADALGHFQDRRAIAGLQAALGDGSAEVQKEALSALGQFSDGGGVPSAPVVALLNSSRNSEVIAAAIHLLAELKARGAAPAIRAHLSSPDAELRANAIHALAELGDEGSSGLILQRLADSNAEVRQNALHALNELKMRIPDAAMSALLKDRDADIRAMAAQVAGESAMSSMVSALISLVDDPDSDVRLSAVQALAQMEDSSAHQALRKALTSKDAKVRRSAVEALGDRRP